jgi:hypothetical protein
MRRRGPPNWAFIWTAARPVRRWASFYPSRRRLHLRKIVEFIFGSRTSKLAFSRTTARPGGTREMPNWVAYSLIAAAALAIDAAIIVTVWRAIH